MSLPGDLWRGSILPKPLLRSPCQVPVSLSLPNPFLNAQLLSPASPPHRDGPAAPSLSLRTMPRALEPRFPPDLCNGKLPYTRCRTPGSRFPPSAPFPPRSHIFTTRFTTCLLLTSSRDQTPNLSPYAGLSPSSDLSS